MLNIIIMPAGLIQIVAYGIQDVFLTGDPQITFFKVMYRRHTNFTIEPIKQFFNTNRIRFGQKVSCTLSRTGDLINKVYLMVTLPAIEKFVVKTVCDPITKFAWVRKIGLALIKSVEIEIGGQLIDKQYGIWMYIWDELTNDKKFKKGNDIMLGNVPELTTFTNGKGCYQLQIPLQFWFCKFANCSLPIVALQYNEVKINVEFEEQDKCYLIGPKQSLLISNPVVHFEPGEWIQQTVGGISIFGIFQHFDLATGTLYYIRASDTPFQSFNTASVAGFSGVNFDQVRQKYTITGLCSGYTVLPVDNTVEKDLKIILPNTISKMIIPECYLDVEYIFLDVEERFRFINTAHEYLIEQVQIGNIRPVQFKDIKVNLSLNQPSRALFWVAQLGICKNINDTFNFTNSIVRDINTDVLCGKNLVTGAELLLNSVNRFMQQTGPYFNWLHPYEYFPCGPSEGVNVYSFGLGPSIFQPSGTCNMSKMDLITLRLLFDHQALVSGGTRSDVTIYGLQYNILRVINGLGGLLFSN